MLVGEPDARGSGKLDHEARAAAAASSIHASPPCSRASSRTTYSPMPLPATDDWRRARADRTSSTRARARAAECPAPSSSHPALARDRRRSSTPTVTVCRRGPYFTALSSRLSTIWRSALAVGDRMRRRVASSRARRATSAAPASGRQSSTIPLHARAQVERLRAEPRHPPLGAREVQNVLDEMHQPPAFLHDHICRACAARLRVRTRPRFECLGEEQDLRQRRAQLVRHARDEIGAQARQLVLAPQLQHGQHDHRRR